MVVRTFSGSINVRGFALLAPHTSKKLHTLIFKSSIMMITKLPLALALLLSASILAAAHPDDVHELRTGVPYYMAPYIWALGGGVAPARVGNEKCPSTVKLTPEVDRGVPVIFSSVSGSEESVVIDEETDVFIRFNCSSCFCGRNTWGNLFSYQWPSTVPLVLLGEAVPLIFEATRFRIRKEGSFYRFYSPKSLEKGVVQYNLASYRDEDNFNRLVLSKEESFLRFVLNEAEEYHRMIKSVV